MKIYEVSERTEFLIQQLLEVWENSVRTTHHFLSDSEIKEIKKYVPVALKNVKTLIIAEAEQNRPKAFMGIEDEKLEMLFINSDAQRKGVGKKLVEYGITKYSVNEVTVNEQNSYAVGFYKHMGFTVFKRSDVDEQGNPYPILYMSIK